MNILICSALSQELNTIKNEIKKTSFKWVKLNFFHYWLWNYNTIFNLTNYLTKNEENLDFIISIWICWFANYKQSQKLKKWDILQVSRIFNIANKKELIVPTFFVYKNLSTIYCSDSPVLWTYNEESSIFDMESYWLEFVLEKFKIPRIFIKVLIDEIWNETINFDKKEALDILSKSINFEELISSVSQYCENNFEKKDFEYIKKHFRLSFCEYEILKKKIYKFETLKKSDFWEFFKKNKNLDKSKFMDIMNS